MLITFIDIFFFVLIAGLVIVFARRYRRRGPDEITPHITHNEKLEIAWSVIPLVIVIGALFQLVAATPRGVAESDPQPIALYIPAIQLGMGLTVLVASTMLVRHASRLVAPAVAAAGDGMVLQLASADTSSIVLLLLLAAARPSYGQDASAVPGASTAAVVSEAPASSAAQWGAAGPATVSATRSIQ